MSKNGDIRVSYTKNGLPRYELEIWHDELNKYQLVKGNDSYVVRQKAAARMKQWDEMWVRKAAAETKRTQRERLALDREQKKQLGSERTEEAQQALENLESILAATLSVDDTIDWDQLKDIAPYSVPRPTKPKPPPQPEEPVYPREPKSADPRFTPELTFLDKLLTSRQQRKEAESASRYKAAHAAWEGKVEELKTNYETAVARRRQTVAEQDEAYRKAVEQWETERHEYERDQAEINTHIDEQRQAYQRGELDAVLDYCELVLNNSQYPDDFPQSFDLDYNPESQILVVDYQLPAPSNFPTLKEVKYIQSRDEFSEKHLSQRDQDKLYDSALYQITLRTLHELFEADQADHLTAIVFNGWVRSVDPATGHESNACVLSVQASKDEFMALNLDRIDPKLCFKNLKGVGSSKLHSITPVAPIVLVERDDSRFVDSYEVAAGLDEGYNLAVMDWEDFEHLIRELFEQEFSEAGGEVKVTQASRDGGIDAVVFDPDPLRGGKIVIQAKRYTNTVGVSAVRDLYGTVMNEGANKGILVTTSDYGPDAYQFASGKPLVLLSGSNLLHLLEKHGHKARIDLKEAKHQAAEKARS